MKRDRAVSGPENPRRAPAGAPALAAGITGRFAAGFVDRWPARCAHQKNEPAVLR
ncbi:hypothetical protein [Mycolicibacterium holsaticum]|uniref:hypothetical protein n=1 Tax=Mycolicibacterium holsaticum TaxID=152142 RepID=UPI0013F4D930|nr:hypothetical protein [Mycolicibacterium holsaticum]